MSINKYKPHVHVLPEDDANRELALGFVQDPNVLQGKVQVLPEVGGWTKVMECFETVHIKRLHDFPERYLILLIDFDDDRDRLDRVKARIPSSLQDRVFVLGVLSEPEALNVSIYGTRETIGKKLAAECCVNNSQIWNDPLFVHNKTERLRLCKHVRLILFDQYEE